MKEVDAFLEVFGGFTVGQVALFFIACVFLYAVYKAIRDHLIKTHDAQQEKDAQLAEALSAVRKYPEYRKQSIEEKHLLEQQIQDSNKHNEKIQQLLEDEIQEIRAGLQANTERLIKLEEQNKKRECNKLRDMLLQNYRYYTNESQNPSKSWTRMEADAFWDLFQDYEDMGGNGYMHSVVRPEMERLSVIEH